MMPGICHQRTGIYFLCGSSRIPEHSLFYHNRHNRCHKCKNAGDHHTCIISVLQLGNCIFPDSQSGDAKNGCQNNGRHTFHAFMPVRMFFVRRPGGYFDAYHDYKSAEYIRCRMYRITDHRSRMGKNPRHQLKNGKQYVSQDADIRHSHCNLFLIFFHGSYLLKNR